MEVDIVPHCGTSELNLDRKTVLIFVVSLFLQAKYKDSCLK
jgi:hypothetical protein